jgi:prevent-host-death family protein
MSTVGMHEAKTRLSQLVQEVEAGGEVIITRHGQPVVRLARVEQGSGRGRGAMRGRGRVTDLSWDEVEAGDEVVAELFDDS